MDGIFTNELEPAGALAPANLMAVEQGDGELKKVTLAELEAFSQRSGAVYSKKTPFLIASDKQKLTIKAGTKLTINSPTYQRAFIAETDTSLSFTALLDTGNIVNGKDYYLFLCPTSSGTEFLFSLTKTNPAGYASADVTLVGGFHTLCANAGTGMTYEMGGIIMQHPLNGYLAGDILPQSVWCLNHGPFSDPEGMVYIPTMDVWVDIYLQSGSGFNTKSVYQGAITRSRQYVNFVEDQLCVNKALLNDEEFAAAMMGSNEKTAVAGADEASATTNGAGGRSDTAGRRMISIYGVEEGCGSLWQWLATTSAAGVGGSIHGQTAMTPAYGWLEVTQTSYGVYVQAGNKGSFWGLCGALHAGGDYSLSNHNGSRARHATRSRAYAALSIGGRGRSRSKYFIG